MLNGILMRARTAALRAAAATNRGDNATAAERQTFVASSAARKAAVLQVQPLRAGDSAPYQHSFPGAALLAMRRQAVLPARLMLTVSVAKQQMSLFELKRTP